MTQLPSITILTTREVCDRYQMSRQALKRKIDQRKFPSPTCKKGHSFGWDLRALADWETKMLKVASRSWDAQIAQV